MSVSYAKKRACVHEKAKYLVRWWWVGAGGWWGWGSITHGLGNKVRDRVRNIQMDLYNS